MKKELEKKEAEKANMLSSDKALQLSNGLFSHISGLIEQARYKVSQVASTTLLFLYWHIGHEINQKILQEKRAEYGEFVVRALSERLTQYYGKGYSRSNLFSMIHFTQLFPDFSIVQTLSGQLGWSHFVELIRLDDLIKRSFYTEMCFTEKWSVRELKQKIGNMLFERTAIAKKPDEVIYHELEKLRQTNNLSANLVLRDPYILDFLGLDQPFDERQLEMAILREMEKFLLEMGTDFAFLARQKRIVIDGENYYIDLLMFHRKLQCLVVIELKMGKFKAQDKGQIELYLRWLEKHEKQPNENSPIGIVLCSEKSTEHVELLQLTEGSIHVAQFITELPPKDLLEEKLNKAIALAKEHSV